MRKTLSVSAIAILGAVLLGSVSCGSSSGGGAGSGGSGGSGGTSGSSACGGGTPVALTVINAPTATPWCTVTVGSGSASAASSQTVCVAEGTVDLKATANSGFILGKDPWHNVTTQNGGSATLKVSGSSACAWVCCPFPSGSGCPTTNQCP